jgi:hypothetical protein
MTELSPLDHRQHRDWLRFGVQSSTRRWGPTWKVWRVPGQGPSTLAVGGRAIGGAFVFEQQSVGWSSRFEAYRSPDRHYPCSGTKTAVLPRCSVVPAGQALLSIATSHRAVRHRTIPGRFRYIAGIPVYDGLANEAQVVVFRCGDSPVAWHAWCKAGWMLLASLELAGNLRVAVIYRRIPDWTGMPCPDRVEQDTVQQSNAISAPHVRAVTQSCADYPVISG